MNRPIVASLLLSTGLFLACGPGGPDDEEPGQPSVSQGLAPTDDPLIQQARALFSPIPDSPPVLENNPATPVKLELGKMLYFEPRLSSSWLISCNTCHNLGLAGVDLLETSIGHGWQKGPRNAPTVLNAVFNIAQFWDGRAVDLAEQAQGPVEASVEMNSTPERAVRTMKSFPEYISLFREAFPGEDDPVTFDNMARAIEVYEATLITPNAAFDQFLKGDASALGQLEKEGLRLFIDKGCTACHSGVNIGGTGYFHFGLVEAPDESVRPSEDRGRYTITNTASDDYVFKSPSLRNITLTAPYFHSGKVWELADAVRIMGTAQLGAQLTDEEVLAIVTYLGSLTGDQPVVEYPILPRHQAQVPLPDVSVDLAPGH
ncbi:MAG: cytochrome-c peroxidase [Longimicrobiales bacterium]